MELSHYNQLQWFWVPPSPDQVSCIQTFTSGPNQQPTDVGQGTGSHGRISWLGHNPLVCLLGLVP